MDSSASSSDSARSQVASEDRDCLRRITQQDESALAELYDRYVSLLYPVALRIVSNEAEAEDIMQVVWLQVWRTAGSYEPSRGVVPAWLLTITRSRALDALRRRRTRQQHESAPEAAGMESVVAETPVSKGDDPVAATQNRQSRQHLQHALRQLEAHHRQVLEMAYWEGLSQSEIASRMGSPLGTIKSWTRQGLKQLHKALPKGVWW